MSNPFWGQVRLASGNGKGRISRIEEVVDKLVKFCADLHGGAGVEVTFEDEDGGPEISSVESGGGSIENFGFKVSIDEGGYVQALPGTAQVWGGEVKVYPGTTQQGLGAAADGKFVYAVCDLTAVPPAWDNTLSYGDMDSQSVGNEIYVPIAAITESGDGSLVVTQLHWGNIVIPAIANAVDVQSAGSGAGA